VKLPRMIPVSSTVKNSRGLARAALTKALRLRSFRAERDKGRDESSAWTYLKWTKRSVLNSGVTSLIPPSVILADVIVRSAVSQFAF
jgi:hypothetical protein